MAFQIDQLSPNVAMQQFKLVRFIPRKQLFIPDNAHSLVLSSGTE